MAECSTRSTNPEVDMTAIALRRPGALPGFGPTLGLTITYVSLIVLVPLGSMILVTSGHGWQGFWHAVLQPRVLAAFRVSLLCALGAAAISTVAGLLIAWVLVRY